MLSFGTTVKFTLVTFYHYPRIFRFNIIKLWHVVLDLHICSAVTAAAAPYSKHDLGPTDGTFPWFHCNSMFVTFNACARLRKAKIR